MVLDFCFCFIMGIGSLGIFVLCSIIGHRASRVFWGFCRIIDIGSLVILFFVSFWGIGSLGIFVCVMFVPL